MLVEQTDLLLDEPRFQRTHKKAALVIVALGLADYPARNGALPRTASF
jgi:hypothetical protein